MSNTTSSIITIGREYGSGGRQIGQEVAKYFGIKCYDKELLERAANDSGICKELFEHHDEKPTNSFLYSLVMDTYSFGYSSAGFNDMPMNHKIFLAQFDAIKKLAEEGPCVMVGRCADYALSDWPDCFSIFIHADMDARIRRIASKYGKSDKEAKDIIIISVLTAASWDLTMRQRLLSMPFRFLMNPRKNKIANKRFSAPGIKYISPVFLCK